MTNNARRPRLAHKPPEPTLPPAVGPFPLGNRQPPTRDQGGFSGEPPAHSNPIRFIGGAPKKSGTDIYGWRIQSIELHPFDFQFRLHNYAGTVAAHVLPARCELHWEEKSPQDAFLVSEELSHVPESNVRRLSTPSSQIQPHLLERCWKSQGYT